MESPKLRKASWPYEVERQRERLSASSTPPPSLSESSPAFPDTESVDSRKIRVSQLGSNPSRDSIRIVCESLGGVVENVALIRGGRRGGYYAFVVFQTVADATTALQLDGIAQAQAGSQALKVEPYRSQDNRITTTTCIRQLSRAEGEHVATLASEQPVVAAPSAPLLVERSARSASPVSPESISISSLVSSASSSPSLSHVRDVSLHDPRAAAAAPRPPSRWLDYRDPVETYKENSGFLASAGDNGSPRGSSTPGTPPGDRDDDVAGPAARPGGSDDDILPGTNDLIIGEKEDVVTDYEDVEPAATVSNKSVETHAERDGVDQAAEAHDDPDATPQTPSAGSKLYDTTSIPSFSLSAPSPCIKALDLAWSPTSPSPTGPIARSHSTPPSLQTHFHNTLKQPLASAATSALFPYAPAPESDATAELACYASQAHKRPTTDVIERETSEEAVNSDKRRRFREPSPGYPNAVAATASLLHSGRARWLDTVLGKRPADSPVVDSRRAPEPPIESELYLQRLEAEVAELKAKEKARQAQLARYVP